jgi:hypothetical protein
MTLAASQSLNMKVREWVESVDSAHETAMSRSDTKCIQPCLWQAETQLEQSCHIKRIDTQLSVELQQLYITKWVTVTLYQHS